MSSNVYSSTHATRTPIPRRRHWRASIPRRRRRATPTRRRRRRRAPERRFPRSRARRSREGTGRVRLDVAHDFVVFVHAFDPHLHFSSLAPPSPLDDVGDDSRARTRYRRRRRPRVATDRRRRRRNNDACARANAEFGADESAAERRRHQPRPGAPTIAFPQIETTRLPRASARLSVKHGRAFASLGVNARARSAVTTGSALKRNETRLASPAGDGAATPSRRSSRVARARRPYPSTPSPRADKTRTGTSRRSPRRTRRRRRRRRTRRRPPRRRRAPTATTATTARPISRRRLERVHETRDDSAVAVAVLRRRRRVVARRRPPRVPRRPPPPRRSPRPILVRHRARPHRLHQPTVHSNVSAHDVCSRARRLDQSRQ